MPGTTSAVMPPMGPSPATATRTLTGWIGCLGMIGFSQHPTGAPERLSELTVREREVMGLAAGGRSNPPRSARPSRSAR